MTILDKNLLQIYFSYCIYLNWSYKRSSNWKKVTLVASEDYIL